MDVLMVGDLPESVTSAIDAETLNILVDGLNARVVRIAPCITGEAAVAVQAEARLILLGVLKRWAEAGSGAFTQQTAGPFSAAMDTRQRTGYNLWPSEVEALADLCSSPDENDDAFMVDMVPEPAAYTPNLWRPWV